MSEGGGGMEFDLVCGDVPVVQMTSSCSFGRHVDELLQTAVGSSSPAKECFRIIDPVDSDIENRLLDMKVPLENCCAAHARRFPECRGIGLSGKRSAMFAVTASIARRYPDNMEDLWEALRNYGLDQDFGTMLDKLEVYAREEVMPVSKKENRPRTGNESRPRNGKESRPRNGDDRQRNGYDDRQRNGYENQRNGYENRPRTQQTVSEVVHLEDIGVDLSVVCRDVPMVDLDKCSLFHEHVSMLLQTAMDHTGKAQNLYEYAEDATVTRELIKHGFSTQDFFIAKLKHTDILAVGLNGKRSVMLAALVAALIHGAGSLKTLRKDLAAGTGYEELDRPICKLMQAAEDLIGRPIDETGNKRSSKEKFRERDKYSGYSWQGGGWEEEDWNDGGRWGYGSRETKGGRRHNSRSNSRYEGRGWEDEDWSDRRWAQSSRRYSGRSRSRRRG
mmetsp:Transcript_163337/g.301687  ORF Transcript_163337/g.301687 Transcript_163337/m.301687 type:complete len:446 (+) Transcript_163337:21-1358(+)